MINVQRLREPQLDALREVANIGAGHAATALSQMTGRRILIEVPLFQVGRLEEIADQIAAPDELMAAVLMEVRGDLSGYTLLLLPEASAVRLAGLLLQRGVPGVEHFGELERSALTEAANILCGAYLNALSEFFGMRLLPSTPVLVADLARAVLTTVYSDFGQQRDHAFGIETELRLNGEDMVPSHVLLLPDVASLEAMLRAVDLA